MFENNVTLVKLLVMEEGISIHNIRVETFLGVLKPRLVALDHCSLLLAWFCLYIDFFNCIKLVNIFKFDFKNSAITIFTNLLFIFWLFPDKRRLVDVHTMKWISLSKRDDIITCEIHTLEIHAPDQAFLFLWHHFESPNKNINVWIKGVANE